MPFVIVDAKYVGDNRVDESCADCLGLNRDGYVLVDGCVLADA
jgi:hypothetical protein